MTSIRRYLATWLVIGIGSTVLVSAGVTFMIARDGLIREYDRSLAGTAQALGTLLVEDERGVELEFDDAVMPEFQRRRKPEYFQIWLEDGRILEKSYSLLDANAELPFRSIELNEPEILAVRLPDGRKGRAVALRVPVDCSEALESRRARRGAQPTATIVVARGCQTLDGAITRLGWWLGGAVVAACFAAIGVVAVTVRRGLRPLVRIGDEVSAIDARHLSARVPAAGQAREIIPLTAKLNELLARLEDAFERERRMTSNLAHELRTPIAEVRAAADVARKWPDDPALRKDAIDTAHEAALKMGGVVDALLRASRAQAGLEQPDWQDVDLGDAVGRALDDHRAAAEAKGIAVHVETRPGRRARTDPGLFGLIANNLVDNAVAHTPSGGGIESRLDAGGSAIVWSIVNSPVDLECKDVGRVGEPLWTKSAARSSRDHAGLGLALARAVAETLGIAIEIALDDRAFRATVRVPLPGTA